MMTSNRHHPVRSSDPARPHRRRAATRAGWLLAGLAFLGLAIPAAAQEGIALTSSTRQSLRHLQELWGEWTAAILQNDHEQATATLDDILKIAKELQGTALPDLSLGASASALEAARAGQLDRAGWALEAARRLDPDRPETDFAAATVARARGAYPAVVIHTLAGWLRIFKLPLARTLVLSNALLWSLSALLLAGAGFVALLLTQRGAALAADLRRLLPLPDGTAGAVSLIVLLLLPVVLPSGLVWVVLLLSALLWAYASTSERVVLVGLWLLVGATPLLVGLQHRHVQLALTPPSHFLDNFEAGRLEGKLFADFTVLRALFPAEDPDVLEVLADLHRRLGQWEDAQTHYRELVDAEPENVPALINLGVTYHRKGDLTSAVFYFSNATRADPNSALAYYDLSQAYSQAYNFEESRSALARARQIDGARVDAWIASAQGQGATDMVFTSDENQHRIANLRRRLAEQMASAEPVTRGLEERYLGLGVALLVLILAVALERLVLARGDAGSAPNTGSPALPPMVSALVPGLEAARVQAGVAAYFALLLPIALLLVPLAPSLGYRLPLGLAAGYWLLSTFAVLALLAFLLIRVRKAQRTQRTWSP